MQKNDTLMVGGSHPNERKGIEVERDIKRVSIRGVDSLIANEWAARQRPPVRFIEEELTMAFLNPKNIHSYEARRAKVLSGIYDAYRTIVDIHNNHDANYAVIGERPQPHMMLVLATLGLTRVVINDWNPYYRRWPQLAVAEVCTQRPNDLLQTSWWRGKFYLLGGQDYATPDLNEFTFYKKLRPETIKEAGELGLQGIQLEPFADIPASAKESLGIPENQKAIALDWQGHFGPAGNPGSVAVQVGPPETWLAAAA